VEVNSPLPRWVQSTGASQCGDGEGIAMPCERMPRFSGRTRSRNSPCGGVFLGRLLLTSLAAAFTRPAPRGRERCRGNQGSAHKCCLADASRFGTVVRKKIEADLVCNASTAADQKLVTAWYPARRVGLAWSPDDSEVGSAGAQGRGTAPRLDWGGAVVWLFKRISLDGQIRSSRPRRPRGRI
jgi:hypothetical protein